jgi:hypothetical protein
MRTANPSAYAYAGSNPAPATHVMSQDIGMGLTTFKSSAPSMAFALIPGAGHYLHPPNGRTSNDAAGFASCYGPLSRSRFKGFRHWASS